MQVAGYAGLLLATPTVLYEVVAYVLPGLTRSERRLLAPIIFGSSILFYLGCAPVHPLMMPQLICHRQPVYLPVARSTQWCHSDLCICLWRGQFYCPGLAVCGVASCNSRLQCACMRSTQQSMA